MKSRIKLAEDLYPVESFFNFMSTTDFLKSLDSFGNGHGYNPEGSTCSFPKDLSEELGGDEGSYNYIEFWTYSGNEDVKISFLDFMNYLKISAKAEMENSPEISREIEEKISKVEREIHNFMKNHDQYEGKVG